MRWDPSVLTTGPPGSSCNATSQLSGFALGRTYWLYWASQVTQQLKKKLPANAGDTGDMRSIHGSGRSPGVGNGNSLQYSCLENSTDRGACQSPVHGVAKSQTWPGMHANCLYYRRGVSSVPSCCPLHAKTFSPSPRALFLILLLYFRLCWLFVVAHGLALVAASWGLPSSCCVQTSRCRGFSCCGAWALGCGLSSYGTWDQLPHGKWDISGLGIEFMFPALAGGLSTTGPWGTSAPFPWQLCDTDRAMIGVFVLIIMETKFHL